MGPTLPAELPKPPFRPKVAGRIGFFFGPLAGALVAAINLRRMGHAEKAKKVRLITLLVSVGAAVILLLTPDAFTRLVGLGMETATYAIFPIIQDADFAAWQAAHGDVQPSNGWTAIGWGFLGLLVFVVVVGIVAVVMGAMGIPIA